MFFKKTKAATIEELEVMLEAGQIEEFNARRPCGRLDLRVEARDIDLRDADLTEVDLHCSQFIGCKFERVKFTCRTSLFMATLDGSSFRGACLAHIMANESSWQSADLYGAMLYFTDLADADLTGAKLQSVAANNANLTGAKFCQADLSGANLRQADLLDVDCTGAIMTGADLRDAILRRTNLADVVGLDSANLSGADLWYAQGFPQPLREAHLRGLQESWKE